MKKYISNLILLALFFLLTGCPGKSDTRITTNGPEVISFKALPFSLTDVKLLDGPFLHATELNKQVLLNYEPDRFLAKFRTEAGLEAKAEHYHGWEDNTIAGHSLGHYLSACALMYQSTGDQEFLNRVNYIVDQLDEVQTAEGDGYMGAFPDGKKILEEQVAKGTIRSQGFDLNGIWVPFYTEHKVMAGLFDAYYLCGNKKALDLNIRFADWLGTITENLNDSLIQVMLHCEHGGINESLAELYAITHNEKYLDLSRVFHHKVILDSLLVEKDILPGKHCNTQIPKLIGLARRYEITGDTGDRKTADFFWNTVVHHHSYVTGGNGNHEYFGPADQLSNRLSEGTTETCNVYNMLKLSQHLFEWDASPEVADFFERALFNHILSSQNPDDGHVTYNLSLDMGGYKSFQDPYWFTCCVGTGMENHAKYGEEIYYHGENELYVTQYIASVLTWKDKGLILKQETKYPEEQGTTLTFENEEPVSADILVRYPSWADKGIVVKVNNKTRRIKEKPGSFIRLKGNWKAGDRIEVQIPFSFRLETMPDNPNRAAIMYGPLVMAGDIGPVDDPSTSDPLYVPILLTTDPDPANWLEPVEGKVNTFTTKNVGRPRDVTLQPFYAIHDRRYTIYWDFFNEESWNQKEQEYREALEKKRKIEEMTIDFVQLGEMQPERDHNFKGENADAQEFKGRKFRESRGGSFSMDMGVYMGQPMALVVEYWGGFPGSKTFDILINNKVLVTENISNKKDGEFIFVEYPIPDALTVDKTKITVTFKAHKGNMAGPVFSVRTIKN
ncbi:MAG: beta-L-arabinofuranosidase domain-containing protein [Bacteroidota bacterium]